LPGFPSLYTLKFTTDLRMQGVMLFGHESKGESYVVTLADRKEVWLCAALVCTNTLRWC